MVVTWRTESGGVILACTYCAGLSNSTSLKPGKELKVH